MGQRMLDALATVGRFGSSELAGVGILPLVVVLGLSMAGSFYVAYLYSRFYATNATGSGIYRAFPLIGVAVTAIFVSVQFSLPMALGLLGALSIVRFRTPVKEPEEIGFVLLVIAIALAAATFNMLFLSLILVVATAAVLLLHLQANTRWRQVSSGTVVCTLRTPAARAKLDDVRVFLSRALPAGGIDSLSHLEESTILQYSFPGLSEERLVELNDGVAAISAGIDAHVHFSRPSDI